MSIKKNDSTLTKVIRWIARILSVPPIILYLVFLIGHLLGGEEATAPITPGEMFGLVALIALSSLMVVGLIIAWKWEGIGGIGIVVCAIMLFTILLIVIDRNGLRVAALINVPFFVPGLIFLISWLVSKWDERVSGD